MTLLLLSKYPEKEEDEYWILEVVILSEEWEINQRERIPYPNRIATLLFPHISQNKTKRRRRNNPMRKNIATKYYNLQPHNRVVSRDINHNQESFIMPLVIDTKL